jgi:pleiotropic regulator 1
MSTVLPPLDPLFRRNAKRTRDVFSSCPDVGLKDEEKRLSTPIQSSTPYLHVNSTRLRLSVKIHDEYRDFKELPPALLSQQGPVGPSRPKEQRKMITAGRMYIFILIRSMFVVFIDLFQPPRTPIHPA